MRWAFGIAVAMLTAGATGAAAQPALHNKTAERLRAAAFAPKTAAQAVDPAAKLVERDAYAPGQGPVTYRASEVRLPAADLSLRVNLAETLRTPTGLPVALDRGQFEVKDVDVTLIRSWPGAVSLMTDSVNVDLSPHAGVGVSRKGGQAEAGATRRVSGAREREAVQRLKDMGVRDGATFGGVGRWYLFAAASGRAVGLNMLREGGGWDRAGWTTDSTGELVGDAQIGVGWRKGDMQTSFGVLHREVRGNHMIFGQATRDDTVAAFSFSIKPTR
jgi:hypothetical protein